MANRKNRHVAPDGGGWKIVGPGAKRASSRHATQAEAIDRARSIVHRSGGGEVVIHGRDGRIRDTDTIRPASDPFPPKDAM